MTKGGVHQVGGGGGRQVQIGGRAGGIHHVNLPLWWREPTGRECMEKKSESGMLEKARSYFW